MSYGTYRDQRTYRPQFFGGWNLFPPVIKALLIANVAVWLVLDFLLAPFRLGGVPIFQVFGEYLALWPLGTNFWPWQLFTYMFVHGGFWHLFFNMFALWMFGMELENTWGSRKFLIYYLVCGLGAGVANLLVAPLVGQIAPTVGASGAVFGVLIAFGMLFPNRLIYLYFLLPVKAKYLVAGWIAIELFYGVTGTSDGIAHVAHLGGAAVGFLFVAIDSDMIPLREWLIGFKGEGRPPFVGSNRIRQTESRVKEATFHEIHTGLTRKRDDATSEVTQEIVDAILDKISKDGYQNLTEEEKRILNEASKKIH